MQKSIDGVSNLKHLQHIFYRALRDALKNSGRVSWIFTLIVVLAPALILAENAWYPLEVDVWKPPFNQ